MEQIAFIIRTFNESNLEKYASDLPQKQEDRKPVTLTPTRPVDNVVITTKGLQNRNTVENKGKLILTGIFPSVQKHDI